MREINKTIYKILKMEEPVEGVNVSQLITDDLIQKSESGEVRAKGGASDLLNKKADLIHGKSTNLKKNLKASGARVTATGSTSAGTKKVVKKVIKKAGSTGSVKVTKKVIKKSGTKTGTRVVKKKPTSKAKAVEKKSSPLPMIILLVIIAAGAGYYYMEFMQ